MGIDGVRNHYLTPYLINILSLDIGGHHTANPPQTSTRELLQFDIAIEYDLLNAIIFRVTEESIEGLG